MLGGIYKEIGIYQIRNLVNGKVYIGSSCEIGKRFCQHKWLLGIGKHHSPYLQNAWNKYGPDAFVFEVLENCSEEDVLKREQWYLDEKKPYDRVNGYNNARFAESGAKGRPMSEKNKAILRLINTGRTMPRDAVERAAAKRRGLKHAESSKEQMRQAKLGVARSEEAKRACVAAHGGEPFFVYKLDGTLVGEFFSMHQAAELLKVERAAISKVLRGDYLQGKGYVFEHVKHGQRSPEEIRQRVLEGKRAIGDRRGKVLLKTSMPLTATNSKTGAVVEFRSMKFAADTLGLSYTAIRRCLLSGQTLGDYSFKYLPKSFDSEDRRVS